MNRFTVFMGLLAIALCAGPANGGDVCGTADPCCDAACNGCCDNWLNPCPGMTGAAEILWLRYQDSEPNSWTNEFHTGSRFTVGYMSPAAREIRVRYFEAEIEGLTDPFWSFEALDIEYAARYRLGCNWRGDLSVGVRDATFHEGGDNNYEDTIGPVIGAHLETDVLCDRLVLFTNARYSHQFGEDVESDNLGSFSIMEVQVGLEANRPMFGGVGFVRGAFETQHWAGVDDNDSEDAGLIGFGLALGLTR